MIMTLRHITTSLPLLCFCDLSRQKDVSALICLVIFQSSPFNLWYPSLPWMTAAKLESSVNPMEVGLWSCCSNSNVVEL